jgi:hypothetical protein
LVSFASGHIHVDWGNVAVVVAPVRKNHFTYFLLPAIYYTENIKALFFLRRRKKSAQKKGLIKGEHIHYYTKFGLCRAKAVKELRHKHKSRSSGPPLFRSSLRVLPARPGGFP